MANESNIVQHSRNLYTEIVAEALFTASERSIMRPLVKNYAISLVVESQLKFQFTAAVSCSSSKRSN
jgi:hypothetical protein